MYILSEREVRVLLDEVTRKFTSQFPDHYYDYKITRLINSFNGANWQVEGVGSAFTEGGEIWRYSNALEDIQRQNPKIK